MLKRISVYIFILFLLYSHALAAEFRIGFGGSDDSEKEKERKGYGLFTVEVKDFTNEIDCTGALVFEKEYYAASQVDSRISCLLLRAGEYMEQGTPVIQLDSGETLAGLLRTREEYLRIFDESEKFKADCWYRQNQAEREKNLLATKSEYFSKELSLLQKEKDYSLKEYNLSLENYLQVMKDKSSSINNPFDSKEYIDGKTKQYEEQLDMYRRLLKYYENPEIRFESDEPAMMFEYQINPGDQITKDTKLYKYGFIKDLCVICYLDVDDFFLIANGTTAEIYFKSFDENYTGEVAFKFPVLERRETDKVFKGKILLKLSDELPEIFPNMECETSFRIMDQKAIVVPVEGVTQKKSDESFEFSSGKGETIAYVYFADEEKVSERKVELGFSNGQEVEVKEGLSAGDVIVLGDLEKLSDKQTLKKNQFKKGK
ncbi:MAG: hypothetical protein PHW04_15265 [Candidatus Wallbacteria bacterium]|nr:hypothetical protein [Candidatus Wallbacteria bacterium]